MSWLPQFQGLRPWSPAISGLRVCRVVLGGNRRRTSAWAERFLGRSTQPGEFDDL